MATLLINGNMITAIWGKPPEGMKYVGDDLWVYDERGRLVLLRLHVYSREAAGSKVLDMPPECLALCRSEIPVAPFTRQDAKQPEPEEPLYHLVYRRSLIAVYQGADTPEGPIEVHRPIPDLFILTDLSRVLYCVLRRLDDFELQLSSPDDRLHLADLQKPLADEMIRLLTDDWINGDTDELLLPMIENWESRLSKHRALLPERLLRHAHGIVQFWREMS